MSKTSSYLRLLSAALMLSGLAAATACGGDDDGEDDDGTGGTAGTGAVGGSGGAAGGAGPVEAIECGNVTCEPLDLKVLGGPPIAACCADGNACGLDSSFLIPYGATFDEVCQARDQPGVLDSNCPDVSTEVPDTGLVISFKGCCRTEVGKCGYMLDKIAGAIEIGLGCVESEPFLDGGSAESCSGAGAGGAPAGSEGGAGGA